MIFLCFPGRECSRPAPSLPRVRTPSLSNAQFLLSYAIHHFLSERLGLLRGLCGGDEGQEVLHHITHAGEAVTARREAGLRCRRVHHRALVSSTIQSENFSLTNFTYAATAS